MVFYRGPLTSSPIKTRGTQELQTCHRLDTSFLSDSSYECLSINPATGSLCVCRRSPRLLSNGYYVLTEDSVVSDDQGNLTLTPTQTNISYKENLARIFRRRRKVRRALATLLSDVSQTYQSWLGSSLFGKAETPPHSECSSWLHSSSTTKQETPICFTYDPTETGPPSDKKLFMPEVEPHNEDFSDHELPSHSLTSLMEVLPQSKYQHKAYCPSTNPASDKKILRLAVFLILTLCIGAAVASVFDLELNHVLLFGVITVAVASLHLSHTWVSKSGSAAGLSLTKTEVITSRNE